jgi:hypothetical protein
LKKFHLGTLTKKPLNSNNVLIKSCQKFFILTGRGETSQIRQPQKSTIKFPNWTKKSNFQFTYCSSKNSRIFFNKKRRGLIWWVLKNCVEITRFRVHLSHQNYMEMLIKRIQWFTIALLDCSFVSLATKTATNFEHQDSKVQIFLFEFFHFQPKIFFTSGFFFDNEKYFSLNSFFCWTQNFWNQNFQISFLNFKSAIWGTVECGN